MRSQFQRLCGAALHRLRYQSCYAIALVTIFLFSMPSTASPISCLNGPVGGAACGQLSGHFEVLVSPTFSLQDSAEASGFGSARDPIAKSGAGTLTLQRIIDTPCPPNCPTLGGPLPNTASVSITGSFNGYMSTSLLTLPPLDPLVYIEAKYNGPGSLPFTAEQRRLPGQGNFAQSYTTTTTLTVGVPVPFDISLNGYAYEPVGLWGDFSILQANLLITSSVLNPNFTVVCVPEPSLTVCFTIVLIGLAGWRRYLA